MVTQIRDIYDEKGRCYWAQSDAEKRAEECESCEGSRRRADEVNCKGYIELCRGGWVIRVKEREYAPLVTWLRENGDSTVKRADIPFRSKMAGRR